MADTWLHTLTTHTQHAVAHAAGRLVRHLRDTLGEPDDDARVGDAAAHAQRLARLQAVQRWAEAQRAAHAPHVAHAVPSPDADEPGAAWPADHPLSRLVALATPMSADADSARAATTWASDVLLLAVLPHAHECCAALMRLWHPEGHPWPTVTMALSWLEATLETAPDAGDAARADHARQAVQWARRDMLRQTVRHVVEDGPLARLGLWQAETTSLRGSELPWHSRDLRVDDTVWAALCGRAPGAHQLPLDAGVPDVPGLAGWLAQPDTAAALHALRRGQPCQIVVLGGTAAMRRTRVQALLGAAGVAAVRATASGPWSTDQLARALGQAWLYQAACWLEDTHDEWPAGGAAEVPPEAWALRAPVALPQLCSAAHAGAVPPLDLPRLRLVVQPLTPVARRELWRTLLPQLGEQAAVLAARYPIEPDEAREVLRDLVLRQALLQRAMVLDDVADGVRQRAAAGQRAGVTRVQPHADWSALLLPQPAVHSLQAAVRRVSQQLTVLDDWGFAQGRGDRRGVRMLFHGTPGTGKTLAAEVMARALGVDLLVVDLASLVSKWIGETEKNLAAVFDLAERSRALLLFDEADALFGKRTDTQDAQDRYANLETAYLLQRLERYEGVAVLTTNLRSQLDAAFSRRFEFIVEFPEPEGSVRHALWRLHLPAEAPLAADVDLAELADWYPLSGAQIKNAALAAAFLAAAEGQPMAQRHFLAAVEREYDKAGRAHPGFPAHHTLNPSATDDWRIP
ncbi:ATP-binding protein [Aquabacterium fontiphilum]|uniref:ATP-binding protein n=1 Tax=Aquabacterium fontiphilum TaxID=450365 RepID=UPI001F1DFE91|nr:ATP-binding protein [Aquabacterium fontiphilum]